MARILTITMNPAIDVSTRVEHIVPGRKLRCDESRRDPGGGGINVARVAHRLGADVTALYPFGGSIGELLRRLVEAESIPSIAIPIEEETREDFTVLEVSTKSEYRFVLEGPHLSEAAWRKCWDAIVAVGKPLDFIVASGSLPPGVPVDFYARIAAHAGRLGIPFALDTSGPALAAALTEQVDLLKPNLREMRELTGFDLADPAACVAACYSLVEGGKARRVALTLGSQGGIFVSTAGAWRAWPLSVKVRSTVGAGDSFLGALVHHLADGLAEPEAFRYGIAAGSAALLVPGTQLGVGADLDALARRVVVEPITGEGTRAATAREAVPPLNRP